MADFAAGRARGRARGRGEPGTDAVLPPGDADGGSLPRGGLAPRGAHMSHEEARGRMERMEASRRRKMDELIIPNTRPDVPTTRGTAGQPVDLVSNFFRVQGQPNWCVYEYHIDFEPEIDSEFMRKALVRAQKDNIGETFIFHGANLVTPHNLGEEGVWHSKRDSDDATINIRYRRTKEVSPDNDESVRILDLAIRKMQLALNLKQSKRDFFDPEAAVNIDQYGLTIWPGYSMTITKYENELLLNMDVIHRVMRTDTCYNMIRNIREAARQHGQDFVAAASRELIGAVVLTKYNNKTHTIDDILWPPQNTPMSTFERRGETITIKDYLRTQYNIVIQDENQPLLVTRPRKMARRIQEEGRVDKLVPELCYMTGLTEAQRSDFRLMKSFGEQTRLGPDKRMQRYANFGRRVASCEPAMKVLQSWNLKLDPSPLQLKGRICPSFKMNTANSTLNPDPKTGEWDRDMKRFSALDPAPMTKWVLIYTSRDENMARELAQTLNQVGRGMNINVDQPKPMGIQSNRADEYKRACQAAARLPDCKLIVCLLGRKDRQTYEAIKKFTLVDCGIPSQCIVVNTLRKGMMSVCTKLLQQICVKLGGSLWSVEIPLKRAMICGFDTYHDSAARGKSVGGFVATIDGKYTKFYSRSFQHNSREELSHYLRPCLQGALHAFKNMNGGLPDIILFYRDGVADNQLLVVKETEVQQLKECFGDFGTDYSPKLSVIVVQKRIRPRFFAVRGNQVDNPLPGTVVDSVVTNPKSYDFYVMAQSVRQGTVTPTRYNIIHESTTLRPDHHHQLAYRLSHLYYNWPGTIRVVAPCHYAHKLAFLIGQHVHADTHRDLNSRLYYL